MVPRYEYGVSSQAASGVPFSAAPELEQVVVALRDRPEEEVGLGADADRGVGAEALDPPGELVDDVGERLLAGRALVDGQPPPRGIDAEEAVRDVLPDLDALDALVAVRHGANGTGAAAQAGRSSPLCARRAARPG